MKYSNNRTEQPSLAARARHRTERPRVVDQRPQCGDGPLLVAPGWVSHSVVRTSPLRASAARRRACVFWNHWCLVLATVPVGGGEENPGSIM